MKYCLLDSLKRVIEDKGKTDKDILKKCRSYKISHKFNYYPDINVSSSTPFRLNRYLTGGWMQRHIDNIAHSHGQEYGFPHITSLLFLNDNYEGGNFILCDGEFEKKPNQGSCVVFPSNFMYPHEVKEVTKGTRYSVMTWIL